MVDQSALWGRRRAGILLHPTSLPGPGRCGTLGPDAFRFIDFLAEAGQTIWQVLPLGPTHDDFSPYQCLSVHAGNACLISAEVLAQEGWLGTAGEGRKPLHGEALIGAAHAGFQANATAAQREDFERFCSEQRWWLDDYALFRALRADFNHHGWTSWPAPLRDRDPAAVEAARARLAEAYERIRFEQFAFRRQWQAVKQYAGERDILLFGDLPIFVAHDSADVWAQREYFRLDEAGQPLVVAGVPPDYFSKTGQRWGNPHYDWERMAADGFAWWIARMDTQLALFDLVRIDHFRGFESYWEVPAAEETAVNGRWVKAPGDALFQALRGRLGALPVVAEDLGTITEEVHALRRKHGFPGMKILEFAFDGGGDNPYLPHNHEPDSVVYTGTHDNDTGLGWFQGLTEGAQDRVQDYLGWPQESMPWPLMRCAYASVSRLAIIPLQDALELGSEHRMNTPGVTKGNWRWRFSWEQFPTDLAGRLRHLCWVYGRDGVPTP